MRAVRFHDYGGPDVLRLEEIGASAPKAGEVLVRVAAAGVNPADWKLRSGMFKAFSPFLFPAILGFDLAGEVIAVGDGVRGWRPGARVAALLEREDIGAYAEIVRVRIDALARLPDALGFAFAAAVPTAGLTGSQLIEDHLKVQAGEHVLVAGATGQVGRFAVHAAKERGAKVTAGVRAAYADQARALGADAVAIIGEEWSGAPFDAVADTVGGPDVSRLCRNMTSAARIATAATIPLDPALLPVEPHFIAVRRDGPRLERLLEAVARGEVPVGIARRFPLARAAEAHQLVEAGGLAGKIILDLSV